MLDWLACRFAPRLVELTEVAPPELPDPASDDALQDRAAIAFRELEDVPFTPSGVTNPFRLLLGMGCRNLVTREADQQPDTAGRAPSYAHIPAFQPVEIPVEGGPVLTGHHSTGAPGSPVVIVVHGLFDSHVTSYVVEYAEVLRRWGFHVVALDMRDHGQLMGKGPASLGLSEGRDLLSAARTLHRAEGVSVGLLGLSYGGQCVVRAAYEASIQDEADVLRGGVMAVCAPLNLHEAVLAFDDATRLPRPRTLFDRLIFRELRKIMRRQLRLRAPGHPLGSGEVYETFVREIVLPEHPEEPRLVGAYLGKLRCTQPSVMQELRVPVAVVHPVDDPLVPVEHARQAGEAAGDNAFVHVRELPAGGHVGIGPVDPAGTLAMLAAFFGRLRDG